MDDSSSSHQMTPALFRRRARRPSTAAPYAPHPGDKLKRALFTAIAVVSLPLLTLLLVEGGTSLTLYTHDVVRRFQQFPPQWKRYTRYDPLLGWESPSNVYIRDWAGPGVYFRTNALGFRGTDDVLPQAPEGRVRILCSGDSFTEGYGVDDDHTWCTLLTAKDRRFQSVNLGQSGYGFDQAYLRYKREGYPLKPAVHIFAFIADDFRRMTERYWAWRGKPTLVVENGALKTENVPVPWLVPKLHFLLAPAQELRAAQFFAKLKAKLGWGTAEPTPSNRALEEVVAAIIRDLSSMSRLNHGSLVLVYLPTLDDYSLNNPWRERLRRASEAEHLPYLDLTSDLRLLSPDAAVSMFIPLEDDEYHAGGHYTVRGHQWVADGVFQYLVGTPEITAQLRRIDRAEAKTDAHAPPAGLRAHAVGHAWLKQQHQSF